MAVMAKDSVPILALGLLVGVVLVAHPAHATAASDGTAVSISAGGYHSCAITSRERLKCWGNNDYGQLGIGASTDDEFKPVLVPSLHNVKSVAVGERTTCATLRGAKLKCWGYNGQGQVGDGTHEPRRQPTLVKGVSAGVKSVSVGAAHACAVLLSGKVKCWGSNPVGELGIGTIGGDYARPQLVRSITSASRVSTGEQFTCAKVNQGAKCWGLNDSGQLGDGTTENRPRPRQVQQLDGGVRTIVAGLTHACAIVNTGRLKCWGNNLFGGVGTGTSDNHYSSPQNVRRMKGGVTRVDTGYFFTCAVKNGLAKCFGQNNISQLGNGGTSDRTVPSQVSRLPARVVGVDVGFAHGCALLKSGVEKCWGLNGDGQVGINQTLGGRIPEPERVLL